MNYAPLEFKATLDQTEAIATTLEAQGVTTELVENSLREPIAVVARGGLDVYGMVGSVPLNALAMSRETTANHKLDYAKEIIPINASTMRPAPLVYPSSILRLLDGVVQSSLDRDDVLASGLNGTRLTADKPTPLEQREFHIDFLRLNRNRLVRGLNVHATDAGSLSVELGILRSFADVRSFRGTQEDSQIIIQRYRDQASPLATVDLEAGDVLIFQGDSDENRNMLPIAHSFAVKSNSRSSQLFIPDAGPAHETQTARNDIIARYCLESAGYQLGDTA
jgi:hypothetical protein